MKIFSYYYGASVDRGIGLQAQSKELQDSRISSALKELSSLHALESGEHKDEMMAYWLHVENCLVLGLSYLESPRTSGYNRRAPLGLQYILAGWDTNERSHVQENLGRIINFVNFQKPSSPTPPPLDAFPLNDCGYYYHNKPEVLSALIEGLVQTACAPGKPLLIALPKGKNSDYATARYTIAEALNCIPPQLRFNIFFFTGLPVGEGVLDPVTGFDNALKYKANVIFCAAEHFGQIRNQRSCIAVNMDQPQRECGAFAAYVGGALDPVKALDRVLQHHNGNEFTVESLNNASRMAREGKAKSRDELVAENNRLKDEIKDLNAKVKTLGTRVSILQDECDRRQEDMLSPQSKGSSVPESKKGAQTRRFKNNSADDYDSWASSANTESGKRRTPQSSTASKKNRGHLRVIIYIVSTIIIGAAAILLGMNVIGPLFDSTTSTDNDPPAQTTSIPADTPEPYFVTSVPGTEESSPPDGHG